jgi:formyl-CoA transferase
MAGQAVLAALIARGATGEGQFVDISLLDCALAALTPYAQSALDTGSSPARAGNSSVFMAPMNIYQCADGPILLIASSNRQFANLCTVVFEAPALAEDPRFRTIAERISNKVALDEILSGYLRKHDRQYWIDRMRPAGIVVGNVRHLSDALKSPEVVARGMIADVGNREQDGYTTVGSPFFFSETKLRTPEPAPLLGADTDAVLGEVLDYSPSRIKELRDAGAIGEYSKR